ncbi:helix-turn-helix transcriptional regulator [Nannocystis punicea]|uniref:Helix-turn-helix transcriptional regulator n=1 Tax=Nannocystis punicea TaxID=2995304 RepID=A0ABY7HC09_9BACT|nr:helix-turn-helix transcriptional regulator [Nannocystis poenicansa]WAS96648.1 helix-turn-helix transcriptional regulator [Nannocystis poenicansa]
MLTRTPTSRPPLVRGTTAIDLVEAAYQLDGTEAEWLEAVTARAQPDLDVGAGLYAFTGDSTAPDYARSPVFAARALSPAFQARLLELNETAPDAIFDLLRKRLVTCGGLEQVLGRGSPVVEHFRRVMVRAGISDGFCMFAQDTEGGSVTLSAPSAAVVAPSPRVRGIWQRVGLHLVAGLRLRRKLAARTMSHDALLSPAGRVEDASAEVAADGDARRTLTEAVQAMDRARSVELRGSPERALELWRGLVAGRWSLVEHWERDGRRYLAAYTNRPGVLDPRALTSTEQSVLRHLALGATNKQASYALGLPEKTVSSCVTQILKKLRARSRVELAALLQARSAGSLDVAFAEDRLRVLAVDVSVGDPDSVLTPSEREVANGVARGLRNAQIASARGVAPSTVAKQLQTIYAKLGVDNRSQLARHLARHRGPARG